MKKTSMLILLTTVMLSSCGIIAKSVVSDNGQMFQDGIYNSSPVIMTRQEKTVAKTEAENLVNQTKASQIYLFGEKKDTIMIPQNMSARIQFDQKVGGTVVTVGENPYDWRYDLENRYGYLYSPLYYSPFYCRPYYHPRHHFGFYDPWYYGGFYDPWYYGGFYDPWYHNPWYPYHIGWHPPHHHHHHPPHHAPAPGIKPGTGTRPGNSGNRWHGLRAETTSGRVAASRPSSSSRKSSTPTYRRPSGTSSAVSRTDSGKSGSYTRSSSSYTRSSSSSKSSYDNNRSSSRSSSYNSSYGRSSSSGSSYSRSSSSGYSRSSSSGSYSRSSSSSGGGYSRSSSGSYRR